VNFVDNEVGFGLTPVPMLRRQMDGSLATCPDYLDSCYGIALKRLRVQSCKECHLMACRNPTPHVLKRDAFRATRSRVVQVAPTEDDDSHAEFSGESAEPT
jgi:hypothetical protein